MLSRYRLPLLVLLGGMLLVACGQAASADPLSEAVVRWIRPTLLPTGMTAPNAVTNLSNMPARRPGSVGRRRAVAAAKLGRADLNQHAAG